ncbi:MAG: ATP-binding protein [Armatimonadota bacterium]|nr:ATP-binding protein [Armatimonadota bacterium]
MSVARRMPSQAEPPWVEVLAALGAAIDQGGLREEAVVGCVAARLAELLGDSCAVLLRAEDGATLRPAAIHDPDPEARRFLQAQPALVPSAGDGPTLAKRVIETGHAALIRNVDIDQVRPMVDPEAWPGLHRFGPRSLLLVPIVIGARAVGVLYLSRHRQDAPPYDDADERGAEQVAERIGHALARARQHADLHARHRRLERDLNGLRAAAQQRVMDRAMAGRDAEAFFENLLATSPVLIWRANATDLSATYVSPNVERILGFTVEEVLEAEGFWKARMPPSDYEALRAAIADADRTGQHQFESEFCLEHKDETFRWLYALIAIERSQSGETESLVGFGLDITGRKAAEASLEQARHDAERANQAKSEFLSRMSHELRTPLNAVLGFAQLLEMDPLSPEQQESLGYILKAGRHLLDLINEVLDIARIEAGRMAIAPESVSLGAVIHEALALTAPLATERAVAVRAEISEDDTHYVLADRQRLKQVLLNLLSNAVKYNKVGGEVVVAYRTVDDRVRVLITDTGPGIPPDKQHRLFIPFERLGTVQGGVEGTGLGLALSKRLTQAMGGSIGVESEVGRGSTFWVELPLAEQPVEPAERVAEQPRTRGPAMAPERHYSVLYIEDNLAHLELIERLVARRPGVRLLSAMQGRIGLNLAREHRPDVILLDVHLPDVPGFELLHRLQADLRTRLIPVVTMSSDPSPEQVERLLASGAHACLAKPIDIAELMKILDELLRLRID